MRPVEKKYKEGSGDMQMVIHRLPRSAAFAGTLLFFLLGMSLSACNMSESVPKLQLKPLSSAQEWAVATSAILWETNKDRHDLLGIQAQTPEQFKRAKQILSEWWGVTNKETLIETMRWVKDEGDRKHFEQLGAFVESLSDKQFQQRLAAVKDNEQEYRDLQLVKEHYKKLGPKSLLAWDYGRYVALARWGYQAGYLTEAEAWERIMPAARTLQKTYDSWADLGENYLLGREFWSVEQTKRNGHLYRVAYTRLLNDTRSPWKRYPWDTDLGRDSVTESSLATPQK